ncbi:HAD-IIB family hydrolase [Ochrovirga pacifica]|uniref:HAD-IIB family hydrolase n=1 Tax=Ochrovirga pacifica TaxID=1042376 RepID=UPI0002558E6E|nr:HAD-IIB family hydrolase [Ochrovirga pacifica]
MRKMVFTDLDGTFLNHDDYSFEPSLNAVSVLKEKKIPLIFTTSKTRKEVEILQKEVGIQEPFIVENGAALFVPKGYQDFDFSFLDVFDANYYVYMLGVPYGKTVAFYNRYKEAFGMHGFSDMDLPQVAECTGLKEKDAVLSKNRDFTEPFLWEQEERLEELSDLALEYGLKITKGGRFYHLIGAGQDKGKAVAKCVALFQDLFQHPISSIGLGDGENDIPLLENVDIPIAIQNHEGKYIEVNAKQFQKSTYKGAEGWNEMILKNV